MKSAKFLLPLILCVSCSKQEEEKPKPRLANTEIKCRAIPSTGLFDDCNLNLKVDNKDIISAKIEFLSLQTEISSAKMSDFVKTEITKKVWEFFNKTDKLTENEKKQFSEKFVTVLISLLAQYKLTVNGFDADHQVVINQDIIDNLNDFKLLLESLKNKFAKFSDDRKLVEDIIDDLNKFSYSINDRVNLKHLSAMMPQEIAKVYDESFKEMDDKKIKIERDEDGNINVDFIEGSVFKTEKFTFKLEKGERVYKIE
ncbi:hypothetical protein [Fluviispira sanaruensis]|uniref:Uncharacterized protein n=1 Tax=Fluviispira sanaruensis TaxID=2493639 RepID=A0A4P2VJ50_FLUSA|nr:hypothetical protein [Fluviispira sanaruensis]BBH53156.1 hypothetical protein JCM31447_15990 [Fluviispira sanaruensis]